MNYLRHLVGKTVHCPAVNPPWDAVIRRSDTKTFGMDRIEQLTITDQRFEKSKDFYMVDKFKYRYGIYSSPEYPIEDIVISCDTEDGKYLKSRPIHSSQRIIKKTVNEIVIGFKLRITPDFIMEIISQSWSVKVLQPQSLREQICDIYRKALERNKE